MIPAVGPSIALVSAKEQTTPSGRERGQKNRLLTRKAASLTPVILRMDWASLLGPESIRSLPLRADTHAHNARHDCAGDGAVPPALRTR